MKKTNWIILPLLLVMIAGTTYGACTCTFDQAATTAGTSSTYIRGTAQNLSVTISGCVAVQENATAGIISSTGTISGATVFNISTGSNNRSYMNTTISTVALDDDSTYTMTFTVKNVSQTTLTTCTRNYVPDNTNPALTLVSPTNKQVVTTGKATFSYTCTDTLSATLLLENRAITMTESSDVCTATDVSLNNGINSWYIIASDGLNSTTSSTTQVEGRRAGGAIIEEDGSISSLDATTTIVPSNNKLILVAIVGVALWAYSKKKKK